MLASPALLIVLGSILISIASDLEKDAEKLDMIYEKFKTSNIEARSLSGYKTHETTNNKSIIQDKTNVVNKNTSSTNVVNKTTNSTNVANKTTNNVTVTSKNTNTVKTVSIEEYLEKNDYEFYSVAKVYYARDKEELKKVLQERYDKLKGK